MKVGNVLPQEAFSSLSEEEERCFNVKALMQVYDAYEELRKRDLRRGGRTGSGRHLVIGDPWDFFCEAKDSLSHSKNAIQLDGLDDLVLALVRIASKVMNERMRAVRGDTHKIRSVGERKEKIFKHHPVAVKAAYRIDDDASQVVDFEIIKKDDAPISDEIISLRLSSLVDKETKTRFFVLLIAKIRALGRAWSDRLSGIFEVCLDRPELFHLRDDGTAGFDRQGIAKEFERKFHQVLTPAEVSNAMRHLDRLADDLDDPSFDSLTRSASRTGGWL